MDIRYLLILALLIASSPTAFAQSHPVIIGSKKFTESYVLGEIAKRAVERSGLTADLRPGIGGTIILWEALRGGAVTCYPEYTGTLREVILHAQHLGGKEGPAELQSLRQRLALYGIGMTEELGFNNTYALVMRRARAQALAIQNISDLRDHLDLVVALDPEFQRRADGWDPLCARYGLQMKRVLSLEHVLSYTALDKGEIDLTDAYSTDPKIVQNDLVILRDDRDFFPQYQAVFLYRLDADPRLPQALSTLAGTLDANRMSRLNALAESTRDYAQAAVQYFGGTSSSDSRSLPANLAHWVGRHLLLVALSLLASILTGVPLGIWASRPGWLSEAILGATGVIQTVPSLALLALLVSVPFLGISPLTAIIALFLYGLLPIVRNTASGLQDIPGPVRESAEALGLEPSTILAKIFLPLASRAILAGIKTSAVINVGTATLAALIGAGGLGEPILSGLNLNDRAIILEGAIPAACLALVVQASFTFLDRFLIPKGLRLNPGS
ncbi:MAG: glycine/betaine ABC transporter substrate-binding protein [Verrucomicrobia bacterium]|nr:MAG: glycine/betaine ABC transporter substrate-binding protein [Verrucomicrobiota bacterium]